MSIRTRTNTSRPARMRTSSGSRSVTPEPFMSAPPRCATSTSSACSVRDYVDAIVPPLRELGIRVLFEPGRFLVGNAGVLLTRVRYIKQSGAKKFAIVDAGMNDLIRPALYRSYHEIVPVEQGRGDSPNRLL